MRSSPPNPHVHAGCAMSLSGPVDAHVEPEGVASTPMVDSVAAEQTSTASSQHSVSAAATPITATASRQSLTIDTAVGTMADSSGSGKPSNSNVDFGVLPTSQATPTTHQSVAARAGGEAAVTATATATLCDQDAALTSTEGPISRGAQPHSSPEQGTKRKREDQDVPRPPAQALSIQTASATTYNNTENQDMKRLTADTNADTADRTRVPTCASTSASDVNNDDSSAHDAFELSVSAIMDQAPKETPHAAHEDTISAADADGAAYLFEGDLSVDVGLASGMFDGSVDAGMGTVSVAHSVSTFHISHFTFHIHEV